MVMLHPCPETVNNYTEKITQESATSSQKRIDICSLECGANQARDPRWRPAERAKLSPETPEHAHRSFCLYYYSVQYTHEGLLKIHVQCISLKLALLAHWTVSQQ